MRRTQVDAARRQPSVAAIHAVSAAVSRKCCFHFHRHLALRPKLFWKISSAHVTPSCAPYLRNSKAQPSVDARVPWGTFQSLQLGRIFRWTSAPKPLELLRRVRGGEA